MSSACDVLRQMLLVAGPVSLLPSFLSTRTNMMPIKNTR